MSRSPHRSHISRTPSRQNQVRCRVAAAYLNQFRGSTTHMSDQLITESSCSAVVKAPIEFVDISTWLFNLPDGEYQRCSPAHIAAAATTTDDGRRMSINVETIGGGLMVQHYVEDIGKKDHCRVLSTSDVLTPTGWTKIKVIWELSVKAIDKDSCPLTNR